MHKTIAILMLLLTCAAASAKTEKVTIQGAVGKLAAVIQTPDLKAGQRVPLVIICHGFTSDKDRPLHRHIADSLMAHGIASIRFDFNGHGESEGDFQQMTVLNEIEDAECVYDYARRLPYVSKIALAGHSQGGVVTAMTCGELGRKLVKAMVLLAPAAALRDDALQGQLMGKTYDPHHLPDYVEIWGGRRVGRHYFEVAQTLPIYETAEKYQGPGLVIHGTWDVTVPYTYGERFSEDMRHVELQLLPEVDHSFSGHEADVASRVTAFLSKQLR